MAGRHEILTAGSQSARHWHSLHNSYVVAEQIVARPGGFPHATRVAIAEAWVFIAFLWSLDAVLKTCQYQVHFVTTIIHWEFIAIVFEKALTVLSVHGKQSTVVVVVTLEM